MPQRLERSPVIGRYIRKRRHQIELKESAPLIQSVEQKALDLVKDHAVVIKYTDRQTDELILEHYIFVLKNKITVNLWLSHRRDMLAGSHRGPNLASRLHIREEKGTRDENRFVYVDREWNDREQQSTDFGKHYAWVDLMKANHPTGELRHGEQISFLNDILIGTIDEGATQREFEQYQLWTTQANNNANRKENQTVFLP